MLAFFGLTSEYKLKAQEALVDIAYFGGGGFDYETVYRMPIRNRTFVLNRIIMLKEKEKEEIRKASKQSSGSREKMPMGPFVKRDAQKGKTKN